MARILSVSYDKSLLSTREMVLRSRGHAVVSAFGFTEALKHCENSGKFDLFILGHSIPQFDKEALISAFRAKCNAPVVALTKVGERIASADFSLEPDPEELLRLVQRLTTSRRAAAD